MLDFFPDHARYDKKISHMTLSRHSRKIVGKSHIQVAAKVQSITGMFSHAQTCLYLRKMEQLVILLE